MLNRYGLLVVLSLSITACGGGDFEFPGWGDFNGSSANSSAESSASEGQSSSRQGSSSSASSSAPPSNPSGLDQRPSNTTCLAGEAPASDSAINLERVFSNLSFTQPVDLVQQPGDNSRWFLLEQAGRILMFDNDRDVTGVSEFADLRAIVDDSSNANESGLLSMAFHPDFERNGEVFLYHQVSQDTTPPIQDDCCVSQLVRYQTNPERTQLDPDSGEVLLSFTAPYWFKNHFGGRLGFDRQGYLYLSIGDGGSSGDPDNRAQNTANLWGSMIRIDVDNGDPYGIPGDNPFADQANFLCNSDPQMVEKEAASGQCPELYAWGLRNPWRWSFDRATDDLWLADVGQEEWEEVNLIQRGGNYGWRIREGANCYNPPSNCQTAGLIDPVVEIPQPEFRSITGGYVYRGAAIPSLVGKYVFGDYITGRFYALADGQGDEEREIEVLDESTGLNIASFGQDQEGEVYLLDYGGEIHKVVPSGIDENDSGPARQLTETGCVDPDAPWEPASGLIPYDLQAPFWSDGADKARWLALPDDAQIDVDQAQNWHFPPGSVLMKKFYLNDALIETRLFKHHTDGQWAGYSYAWNEEGTDAELVQGGEVIERHGQDWIYPSGNECLQCHTRAAGHTLGPETAQLNREIAYPRTGRTANQLDTLTAIGILAGELDDVTFADPYANLPLEELPNQARAYLHTNCAQCHRPEGPTNVNMDLRATTALTDMNICDVAPQSDSLGSEEARRLAPGDADASELVSRMALRHHAQQMPPIGSNLVDAEGEALLREWINSLSSDGCL